ncbi:NAD-dependent epimerase/dehydratase family protein [Agromyces sp. NPDC058136]|uniref:NAD-dependent epimerase/dehydratase family protein n=1 Tax=Agromyces sp. NPDC058136 TaxID=3346354 RepID=UPI0036D78C9B
MSHNERTLAVLGASGFVGGSAVRAAVEAQGWVARPVTRSGSGSHAVADVRDTRALKTALAGADVVIHAASYIGNDAALCAAVNVQGTLNAAHRATAEGARLVYLSTAAVYGRGPHKRVVEGEAPIRPASPRSASRAEAERIVLDHGGVVVRPHLVVGAGDRWVGSGVLALTNAVGGLIENGAARHSVIEVGTLGRLLVALATHEAVASGVYHAANLAPLTARQLYETIWPDAPLLASVSASDAARTVTESAQLGHALDLLATDHTFDSGAVFSVTGLPLDDPFELPRAALDWYRTLR